MTSRLPLRFLSGHLGASVSALVDGQLDCASTQRAWAHVGTCPPCRRLVEHEGWLKRELAQIGDAPQLGRPSAQFLGDLLDLDQAAASWSTPEEAGTGSRGRRRVGIVLVGAGSVSAAVLGLSTLGGASLGPGSPGGSGVRPATSIGNAASTQTSTQAPIRTSTQVPVQTPTRVPTRTPTRALVPPAGAVLGRLPGWSLGPGDAGVARARAIDATR